MKPSYIITIPMSETAAFIEAVTQLRSNGVPFTARLSACEWIITLA